MGQEDYLPGAGKKDALSVRHEKYPHRGGKKDIPLMNQEGYPPTQLGQEGFHQEGQEVYFPNGGIRDIPQWGRKNFQKVKKKGGFLHQGRKDIPLINQ